jgi:hypothetical protein
VKAGVQGRAGGGDCSEDRDEEDHQLALGIGVTVVPRLPFLELDAALLLSNRGLRADQ